jgi:hypothetical protein
VHGVLAVQIQIKPSVAGVRVRPALECGLAEHKFRQSVEDLSDPALRGRWRARQEDINRGGNRTGVHRLPEQTLRQAMTAAANYPNVANREYSGDANKHDNSA